MQQGHDGGTRRTRTPKGSRTRARARWLGGLLATIVVATLGLTALLGGSAQATANSKLHLVPGVLAGLSRATPLGAAAPSTEMTIGVSIAGPHQAAEDVLQREMYEKNSPDYHDFLTVKQFQARFGVTPATTAAVKRYLTAGGLSISLVEPSGAYLLASGRVSQLDKLFHVAIGHYRSQGKDFLANDVAPSVPDALPINAILGLDTVQQFTLDSITHHQLAAVANLARLSRTERTARVRGLLAREHRADAGLGGVGVGVGSGTGITGATVPSCVMGQSANIQLGCEQTYTPQEMWGIYNMPGATTLPNASTGLTTASELAGSNEALGQGQTIGVFGEGETSSVVAQLRLFEAATGLPKIPTRTIETEGLPDSAYGDNSGAPEWSLDSQASTGMAPDARQLDFYFSKTLFDPDVLASFTDWAADPNGPREMNASFGECEENPTNPVSGPLAQQPYGTELGDELEAAAEPELERATMEGRTLFSSAGDTGSGCPEVAIPVAGAGNGVAVQPVPLVSYPCDSAYAVCVGGTVVSSKGDTYATGSGSTSAETSWAFGGGGSSAFINAPAWQDGVTNIDHDCISTPSGVPDTNAPLCRGVPDVSDLSGNVTGDGYFVYEAGSPSVEGGTSLSSPLMMGQWARIQSAASSATQSAGGLGFADPLIYSTAASADACSTTTSLTTTDCAGQYANDFNDVTQSELQTGNGVYRPGPGWDYASGWGSLNVSNFMQTVDGETTSPTAYTGAEQAAATVCTASMNSPVGNATDPVDVSFGNQPGADLTNATLTSSSPSTITATLTVPQLSAGVPAQYTGINFYVLWEYNGVVYYAAAEESGSGFTYTSGNTGPFETNGSPNDGSFTDTKSSAATGSANTTTGVITITVPTSEVGAPPAGALLTDPQALDEVTNTLAFPIDSSSNLRAYSVDNGQLDSIGVQVPVDGVLNTNCTNTLPVTDAATSGVSSPSNSATPAPTSTPAPTASPAPARPSPRVVCETASRLPLTHITHKALSRTELRLSGFSAAHCPDAIRQVSLAIARTVRVRVRHRLETRCEFLVRGRFSRAGSCAPHDYLTARGTTDWSFAVRVTLSKGIYYLWEHARDSRGLVTRNVASKHVFFRVR